MKCNLKVGDKVTTEIYDSCKGKILTISKIVKNKSFGSGYGIWTDDVVCDKCGHVIKGLKFIDSPWFKKVE